MSTPSNTIEVTLATVNSVFGISGDTLRAIAASYGVTEEQIIQRALTHWAKAEIPDLDLDAPIMTAEQLRALKERRKKIDSANHDNVSLLEMFKSEIQKQGVANNGNANSKLLDNGEHS